MIHTLKDTCSYMLSDDYKDRFKAEYHQTRIRFEKLKDMVDKWDKGKLPFNPICSRDTYNWQLKTMEEYLQILKMRANMEGIEL